MVLAFELLAFIDADGEPHPTMQASVLPDIHIAIIGAPDGEFAAQQLALIDMAEGQVLAGGDGVPVWVG